MKSNKCITCGKELPDDWDDDECEECQMDDLASNILWSPLHPNLGDLCGKQ